MTRLDVWEVCAELMTSILGRRLDDDASVMLRETGGARGPLWASQAAVGNENQMRLTIVGRGRRLETLLPDGTKSEA